MKKLPETMKNLEADGIPFAVLVKYNIPSYPFYENAKQQTDMVSDVYHVSFYATSANYGETLSDEYINSLKDKKYLSPDKVIDASTCMFPDTTWFVKNISHDPFPPSIDKLIYKFVRAHGNFTVFDDANYTQYLDYIEETDTLVPLAKAIEDDNNAETPAEKENFIQKILRFFRLLIQVISDLFNKE